MSAHTETGWAFSAVAPLIEGGDGHPEIVGKLGDGEEPIEGVHGAILEENPRNNLAKNLCKSSARKNFGRRCGLRPIQSDPLDQGLRGICETVARLLRVF
jgi:hypothetical protein